jgi:amino acid permease
MLWFNTIKAFIGIGLLTFPFAFALAGWLEAAIATAIIIWYERTGFRMILDTARIGHFVMRPPWITGGKSKADREERHQVLVREHFSTYPDLGTLVGGRPGFWLVMAFLVLSQMGATVGYVVFLSSNIREIVPSMSSAGAVFLASACVFPLVLPTRLDSLAPVALTGMLTLLAALTLFSVRCGMTVGSHGDDKAWAEATDVWSNTAHLGATFRFLGIALFAAEGVTQILPVRASLLQHMAPQVPGDVAPGSGWDPLGKTDVTDLTSSSSPPPPPVPADMDEKVSLPTDPDEKTEVRGTETEADEEVGLLACMESDRDVFGAEDAEDMTRMRERAGAMEEDREAESVANTLDTERHFEHRHIIHQHHQGKAVHQVWLSRAADRYPHQLSKWYSVKLRRGHRLAEGEETLWCISDSVLVTVLVFLIVVGFVGWQCLGPNTPSIITRALDSSPLGLAIRALLVVYISCTYPIALFPVLEAIELSTPVSTETDWFRKQWSISTKDGSWTIAGVLVRLFFVTLSALVALLVTQFALAMSLVGWICLGGLSFIIPPVLRLHVDARHRQAYVRYLKRHPKYHHRPTKDQAVLLAQTAEVGDDGLPRVGVPPMTPLERRMHWVYLIVGFVFCVAGAAMAVWEAMNDTSQGRASDTVH